MGKVWLNLDEITQTNTSVTPRAIKSLNNRCISWMDGGNVLATDLRLVFMMVARRSLVIFLPSIKSTLLMLTCKRRMSMPCDNSSASRQDEEVVTTALFINLINPVAHDDEQIYIKEMLIASYPHLN